MFNYLFFIKYFFWGAPFGYLYSFCFQCNSLLYCLHPSSTVHIWQDSNSHPLDQESITLTTRPQLFAFVKFSLVFGKKCKTVEPTITTLLFKLTFVGKSVGYLKEQRNTQLIIVKPKQYILEHSITKFVYI